MLSQNIDYLEKILHTWLDSVLLGIPKIILAIILLIGFVFLANLAQKISRRFYKRSFPVNEEIASIIASLVYFFFIMSGILLALQILGLEKILTNVLAGAGIIGIVAGFALKDIASNLFAGLFLKIQLPFKKGDFVDIKNNEGYILEIGWITTKIDTISGQIVYIPNQIIYNDQFVNFSYYNKRRVIFKSGVAYGDDLDLVKRAALEEVQFVKNLVKDEVIDFYFTGIGSSSYNFELRFWIHFERNVNYKEGLSEIIMRIKKRFEKENISLAYQVTTLDFGVKGGVNIFDKPIQLTTRDIRNQEE